MDIQCLVDGCSKPVEAKELCSAHYTKLLRHGDPLAGRPPNGKALDYLQNTVLPHDSNDCLIWPFSRDSNGYARIRINGVQRNTCRLICEHTHGPPPTEKHQAAHACGKGREGCVNRRHLRWATQVENLADRVIHGTAIRGERHGAAKLTEADVHAIREAQGLQREIAVEFGVSQVAVSGIKSGKTWRHLKDVTPKNPEAGDGE